MAVFQSWGMTPGVDHAAQREFYEHGTRIELLMNPRDPDCRALQGLMYRLLNADGIDEKNSATGNMLSCVKAFSSASGKLQKWNCWQNDSTRDPVLITQGEYGKTLIRSCRVG